MADSLKIPPHNKDAEMAVLGSIMIDRGAIARVVDILTPDDFYFSEHALIYNAMVDLFEKNAPLDILSLQGYLGEKGLLERVGNASYLASLVNSVTSPANIVHYATTVNKKRVLRDLISAAHYIGGLGYQEDQDVEVLLDEAEQRVFGVSNSSLRQKFSPVRDALSEAWERIDMLHKGKGTTRGIPTGFEKLDNLLSGLQKSDFVVLAARPSFGKTALALDIARHAAVEKKIPVGIFSLEMSTPQLVDRFIAAEAHVDLWKLRTGRLSEANNDFLWIKGYGGNYYSTRYDSINRALNSPENFIMILVPEVLPLLLDYAGKEKVLPFYIRSPDEAVLRSRLEKRGEREDSIERRLKESRDWDVQADESGIPYFYITNNGTLEEAVGQVKKYLQ